MSTCSYCQISGLRSGISSAINVACRQPDACALCQKVFELDNQINSIRRELEVALKRREALASLSNEHHDLLITSLPVEVVSRIFLECRPIIPAAHNSQEQYDAEAYTREVFKLSHVCKTWRLVAQSSPQLWTILAATVTERNCERMGHLISQWVDRSGSLPLFVQTTLDMEFADLDDASLLSNVHRLLSSIIDHAERWQTFDITMPSTFSPWISASLSCKSLNNLDLLKSNVLYIDDQPEPLQLKASPTIWCSRDYTLQSTSITNFNRLTQFITDSADVVDMLELLRGAPHLWYLRIDEIDGVADISALGEPVVSTSLRVLILKEFYNYYFGIITLPALHTLHLFNSFDDRPTSTNDLVQDGTPSWWTPVVRFIQRSGCKLEELKIHDSDGGVTAVFLSFTPHLKRLILSGRMLDEDLLIAVHDAMAFPSSTGLTSNSKFLRQLETLHCLTPNTHIDLAPLVAFLENATSRPESSFQRLTFQYTTNILGGVRNVNLNDSMYKRLMDVVATKVDLKVWILNKDGQCLMEQLQTLHS